MTAEEIKHLLRLEPLGFEGGFFCETYKSRWEVPAELLPKGTTGARSIGTAIYYLVTPESFSALHRLPGCAVSRSFETFGEAIEQANRLPYGLAAFAFTENGRRANLIGDLVESGMVGINTFAISGADTPFGGVKDSGFGSEGGKEGLESYQVVKAIHQA